MKSLRRLYYSIFITFERLEIRVFTYSEADELLKENSEKPEEDQWHIAIEEDSNHVYGTVYLERKRRVWE